MKKRSSIIAIFIIIIIVVLIGLNKFKPETKVADIPTIQNESLSIKGCYIAGTEKDVYTLNIKEENGEGVSGHLSFKNFQKDSSSGTFVGTYKDGILLGDYSFKSEGMDSVMQVIFKKSGDSFVRGYGEVNGADNRFTDLSKTTYNLASPLDVFKKGECPSNSKL